MVISNLCSFPSYVVDVYKQSFMEKIGALKVFLSTGFVSLYFPELGDLNSDAVFELLVEVFTVAEEEQKLWRKT
jgi:hypothetical protein